MFFRSGGPLILFLVNTHKKRVIIFCIADSQPRHRPATCIKVFDIMALSTIIGRVSDGMALVGTPRLSFAVHRAVVVTAGRQHLEFCV
jgi:hypothetical protein